MKPDPQRIDPLLQQEVSIHHPASSVQALLDIMAEAERGNLVRQSELFADMEERDAHLFAELHKRKIAVSQLDWSLKPVRDAGAREKKDLAHLQDLLTDSLDIESLVFDLADGIGHGFAAAEITWHRLANGWWLPKMITPRPQRWFTVDIDTRQTLRLRSPGTVDGVDLNAYGWLLHRHSSKTGYPATQGLLRALVMPYLFKNFAVKNWLRFSELYGVPLRVLMTNISDPAQKNELIRDLQGMGANGVAILDGIRGEDFKTVDIIKGEGQGFTALIDWADRSMSKAILGGTLTSDTGKNGNYATANVHDEVRLQIRDHDAQQLAETLTRDLLGAIIAVNGWALRGAWVFDTQEPDDLALYADALPKLVAVGAQIPLSYLHNRLKIPLPEAGEAVLSAPTQPRQTPANPGLSAGLVTLAGGKPVFTPEQQVIEDLGDQLLDKLPSPIDAELIASAIRAAKNPEDLEQRLAAVLAGADLTEFSQVLEKALFAADVLGYTHAG